MSLNLSHKSKVQIGLTLVGRLTGWNTKETDGQADVTTFDSTEKEYMNLGLVDGAVTMEMLFESVDVGQGAIEAALGGDGVAVNIFPTGDMTSGAEVWIGTVVINDRSINAVGGSAIAATVSGTGRLSLATVS